MSKSVSPTARRCTQSQPRSIHARRPSSKACWISAADCTASRTNAVVMTISGAMTITAMVAVLSAAARVGPKRASKRACTGWNTMASTAAHPSGVKNGATIWKTR